MKLQREISAGIAIPIVAAVLWFAPPWAFGSLAGVLGLATLLEFYRLAEGAGLPVPKTLALLFAAGILAAAAAPAASPSGVVVAGGIFLLAALFAAAELVSDVPLALSLAGAGAALLGIALVVLPFCGLMWLDRAYLPGATAKFGARLVFFLFATIWACDSFAYYVGKNLGRRKLAPEVSPKKPSKARSGGSPVRCSSRQSPRRSSSGSSGRSKRRSSAASPLPRASWGTSWSRCSSARRASRTRASFCPGTAASTTGSIRCFSPFPFSAAPFS